MRQLVSSIERYGWSEINFEIEVEGGLKEQKHGGIRLSLSSLCVVVCCM